MLKLNLGCGDHPLDGWLNADITRLDDSISFLDARRQFDFDDSVFDLIFSEHMLEHLTFEDARNCLRECFRALKPGGTLRLSIPDMHFLLSLISNPCKPEHQAYIQWAVREFLLPPGPISVSALAVVNNFVRAWGHQFIWTQDALLATLLETGFVGIARCWISQSDISELQNLENISRMPAGLLNLETMCIEARKSL